MSSLGYRPGAITPSNSNLRFDDAVADVLNDYKVNGRKTHDHVKRRIDLHLLPYFRGWRMADITTADIRAFTRRRLDEKASAAEINRELAVVKRAYSLALKEGWLHVRPHIPMLAEHNVRRGFLEPTQFAAVKSHLPTALRPFLEFAYLTGWPLASEVMPLEWRNIEWRAACAWTPAQRRVARGAPFPLPRRSKRS